MSFASSKIVQLLLENGANANTTDINGNNPLMCACAFNRLDNVKFWLKQFPDWNLEARNTILGGMALGCAVYMGPNRYALTKFLLESGAMSSALTNRGISVLTTTCSNEDSDPDVVKLLLEHHNNVNLRSQDRTMIWKMISIAAKMTTKVFSSSSSGLSKSIAMDCGATALHYATIRGDMEIVEILLGEGADPSLKNDLGQDAAAMCKSFPELRGVLEKRERKSKLHGRVKKEHIVEVLGKRISTATPIQHELANRLAHGAGLTTLHYAARRGDVEIVELLLDAGANPYLKNELGLNSFDISEKFGPFPSVTKMLLKYEDDNAVIE